MRRVLTTLAVSIAAAAAALPTSTALASPDHAERPTSFAVIGDMPYGDAEVAAFPAKLKQIDDDRAVSWVAHLGDIKSGSSVCSDEYFALIKQDFDRLEEPLVYTPGDNEWTDCHRPNNGAYNPLERLDAVREVFFAHPGTTLGRPMAVRSQQASGLPENVSFEKERVGFAVVHVVGSNNSLAPWTGQSAPTPEQTAEVLGRTAAVIEQIHEEFARARHRHLAGVVLMMQADMFDPTVATPAFAQWYAFQPIVQAIARESRDFGRPVYLFNGDSHTYTSDQPLAEGSSWSSFYRVSEPVPNLRRVTVDGSGNAHDYLRVTIVPNSPEVLRWVQVPYTV